MKKHIHSDLFRFRHSQIDKMEINDSSTVSTSELLDLIECDVIDATEKIKASWGADSASGGGSKSKSRCVRAFRHHYLLLNGGRVILLRWWI